MNIRTPVLVSIGGAALAVAVVWTYNFDSPASSSAAADDRPVAVPPAAIAAPVAGDVAPPAAVASSPPVVAAVAAFGAAAATTDLSAPRAAGVTTLVAERLLQASAQPGMTSMGLVPAAGSKEYGAPDRLSSRRINDRPDSSLPDAGAPVASGDAVRIRYQMYELMSGREVEASPADGLVVRVGVNLPPNDATGVVRVPQQVAEVLSMMKVGDVVEVVLPIGTPDLPPMLDPQLAHKLHITIVGRS